MRYLLSYFDTKENQRKFYLNRTSWETKEQAEDEYDRIVYRREQLEDRGNYSESYKTKWAIEAFNGRTYTFIESL